MYIVPVAWFRGPGLLDARSPGLYIKDIYKKEVKKWKLCNNL